MGYLLALHLEPHLGHYLEPQMEPQIRQWLVEDLGQRLDAWMGYQLAHHSEPYLECSTGLQKGYPMAFL